MNVKEEKKTKEIDDIKLILTEVDNISCYGCITCPGTYLCSMLGNKCAEEKYVWKQEDDISLSNSEQDYYHLNNQLKEFKEDSPEYEDLDSIYAATLKDLIWDQNVSILPGRNKFSKLEKAFSDRWYKENNPVNRGANSGNGLLQDLFIGGKRPFDRETLLYIERSHRIVAATAIQWLGTNAGKEFLDSVLKECGLKIVKI